MGGARLISTDDALDKYTDNGMDLVNDSFKGEDAGRKKGPYLTSTTGFPCVLPALT